MSEEEKQELQPAAGGEGTTEHTGKNKAPEPAEPESTGVPGTDGELEPAGEPEATSEPETLKEPGPTGTPEATSEPDTLKEPEPAGAPEADQPAAPVSESAADGGEETISGVSELQEGGGEDPEEEIDQSNAEDAEDSENERRHQIPFLDYHSLSLENLVGELQRLLRTEKVQAIRKHVDAIKHEFDLKFQDFIEEKKEAFVSRGGNEADFRYNSVTKRQFNDLFAEYREKRNQYYQNLERALKDNLENRLSIIEELKGLVSMEEDMTTTYKAFKELQERWRKAGAIPRANYNDVWRTYHHHVEIFYDFLHLNRELRDLDFKFNLEEKEKLCAKAEALVEEQDINKAFRELQVLHKVWKEDIGPVAQEQREAIWNRFSEATKKIHQRRQEYFQQQEERYVANLEEKQNIISQIEALGHSLGNSHRAIQKQMQQVEALREQFFKAGKVPQKDNEATWAAFKKAVRTFNRAKNAFYKDQKKEQQENLDKKRALLQRALELKDSEDMEAATPEMKQLQKEWKETGHVPRKYSDKIWKQFKEACNQYFDRIHSKQSRSSEQEQKNLELKSALLEELRGFTLSGDRDRDVATLEGFLARWNEIGQVPRNKKHLNSRFQKILEALMRKLGISKQEGEILRYGDRIQQLSDAEDERAVEQERQFVRKKIEEVKGEIRQLENNLNFFSDPTKKNPLAREVIETIEGKKEALDGWKGKLKKLNILKHQLQHEGAGAAEGETEKED
jgi:hypothetical protein